MLVSYDFLTETANAKLFDNVMDLFVFKKSRSTERNNTFFSPRLRPLKGHERSYSSCKMNRIYVVQSLTDECKYTLYRLKREHVKYLVVYYRYVNEILIHPHI